RPRSRLVDRTAERRRRRRASLGRRRVDGRHQRLRVTGQRRDGHRRLRVDVVGALNAVDAPPIRHVDAGAEPAGAVATDGRADLRAAPRGIELAHAEIHTRAAVRTFAVLLADDHLIARAGRGAGTEEARAARAALLVGRTGRGDAR